jgi:hypothetical protein
MLACWQHHFKGAAQRRFRRQTVRADCVGGGAIQMFAPSLVDRSLIE